MAITAAAQRVKVGIAKMKTRLRKLGDTGLKRIMVTSENDVNKAKMMQEIIEQRFAKEATRTKGGKKWKKLKPATIKDRMRGGYGASPILERTVLLKHLAKRAVANTFKAYSRIQWNEENITVDYAKYHQTGGGNLPERPFFYNPNDDELVPARKHFVKVAMKRVKAAAK